MYLLDSNVFIEAKNRHYPFDVVPGFWDWLIQAHETGLVFVPEKAYVEVVSVADELAEWFKARPKSWRIAATSADQPALSALSVWANSQKRFTAGAVSDFLSKADYYLVAQAATVGYTVVTHETPSPDSRKIVKIPDACAALHVAYMNPFKMLQIERVRFQLST